MRIRHLLFHVVCCLLLTLPGCKGNKGKNTGPEGALVKASVVEARLTDEPVFHEAVGTVRAEATGVIAARTTGTVNTIKVREGDRVQRGDLLLVIGDPQLRDRIQQAESAEREASEAAKSVSAARDAAIARADLANATFRRHQSLIKQNAVSRQEFDQAEAGFREATASRGQTEKAVKAAKARLAQAEAAVRIIRADAESLAPYDGVVIARHIEAGSIVSPGTPLLTIERTDALRADVNVPDSLASQVTTGDSLRVTVPDAGQETLSAMVIAVEPAADPRTRTVAIQAQLSKSPAAIRSGMFVRALLPMGTTKTILAPETAIVRQGQLVGVFVLDSENRARFRLVRPGAAKEAGVEILAGLRQGERFVTHPTPELADGTRVEAAP